MRKTKLRAVDKEANKNKTDKQVFLNPYQEEFVLSPARFSAIISAIGTGKTYAGLLKCWQHCIKYPNSLGLIVRKEFNDLKMSTMKDFEHYFGVEISSDKSFRFPNGSVIMFTHGDLNDVNVLKNINLNFFFIEQAEEYETDEIFHFLRDRLRRNTGPRWAGVIANAKGHNWLYNLFIEGAICDTLDKKTGQYVYTKNNRYLCTTANTFANAHNLPADFIDDCKAMEIEAYTHYMQFVMNDFNIVEEDDLVFTPEEIQSMRNAKVDGVLTKRDAGADVARFGKDKSVCIATECYNGLRYKQTDFDVWGQKDSIYTVGRITDFVLRVGAERCNIDADGIGGPMYDSLKDLASTSSKIYEFHGGDAPKDRHYLNIKTEIFFKMKELASKGWLQVQYEPILNELATIKYRYHRSGRKMIVPKDEMRKKGIPSPNLADALMMSIAFNIGYDSNGVYKGKKKKYNNNVVEDQIYW